MIVYIHMVAVEEDHSEGARRRGYIEGTHTHSLLLLALHATPLAMRVLSWLAEKQQVKIMLPTCLPNDVRFIKIE